MGRFERSIKEAYNETTGEIVQADELFDNKIDGFEIRKEFHESKIHLSCLECGQDLNISGSKYDRLHFKHKYPHEFCILTDGNLSPKEHRVFTKILNSKESERHIELKNKIGLLLANVKGVDKSSIVIDSKFLIRDQEKRKPDVYCKYNNKELVFEIQLSDLSLGYILSRYDFYKKNKMYLIWILDSFDIQNQGTLERDIKYLTKYENFFKVDEDSNTFKLNCEYKYPFITEDNKFLTKWINKSVSLDQIHFDKKDFQIYYYNFGDNKIKVEDKQKEKEKEIEAAEKRRVELELKHKAEKKAGSIINKIKANKENKIRNYSEIIGEIELSTELEIRTLNKTLSLNTRTRNNKPILNYWFASTDDDGFIDFLLSCKEINLEVNKMDQNGKSLFQELLENTKLEREPILKLLFKRGYILTVSDSEFFEQMPTYIFEEHFIYKLCSSVTNKWLIDSLFRHQKLIFIIESARQNRIIGFKFKNWISFANNAIYHHKEHWEYIELAFKKYGLWEIIINSDKKSTFRKKVNDFYSTMPNQKYDFDEVFNTLFHDIQV